MNVVRIFEKIMITSKTEKIYEKGSALIKAS